MVVPRYALSFIYFFSIFFFNLHSCQQLFQLIEILIKLFCLLLFCRWLSVERINMKLLTFEKLFIQIDNWRIEINQQIKNQLLCGQYINSQTHTHSLNHSLTHTNKSHHYWWRNDAVKRIENFNIQMEWETTNIFIDLTGKKKTSMWFSSLNTNHLKKYLQNNL